MNIYAFAYFYSNNIQDIKSAARRKSAISAGFSIFSDQICHLFIKNRCQTGA